jgi:LmbE family N-acetylglucosaminyl deacetylase
MIPAIDGPGTPEAQWRAWSAPSDWPELDLSSPPPQVVVVAPHPDDEVLGVGGLMTLLEAAGSIVTLVAVTDGAASHPGSPTLTPADLAVRRARERTSALQVLGMRDVQLLRVGLPDGDAASFEPILTTLLGDLLGPDDWCVTTWRGDGHPDHEATGRAAAAAADEAGCRLLEFPVWAWHWAVPGDDRMPWDRARRISLPSPVSAAKRAAAAEYRTQVQPLSDDPADAAILPPEVLERLLRDSETVFW